MSEFTELSKRAYVAIGENDLDSFLEVADENVEFNSMIENKTYHGHDGIREWWENVVNRLGGVQLDLKKVEDMGDRGYVKLVARSTGRDLEVPAGMWQAMRLENGKAVWFGFFPNEDEARKALGLGEGD